MNVLTLKFVQNGHRTPDPTRPHFYEISGRIPLEEVVLLKNGGTCPWTDPRENGPNTGVAKDIRYSALFERGKFHRLNRGPVLIADSAKLDANIGSIVVDFGSSSKKRGLADGGTTVTALVKEIENGFQQSEEKEEQQYVNIRVMCGPWTDSQVEEVVEALNTNKQVDDFSMADYRNEFKWVEKALKSAVPPVPKVSYHVGDDGEYTIQEVIQVLSLFALEEPTMAYVSKKQCLEAFRKPANGFEKFAGILPELLYMWEYIPATLAAKYNKAGGKIRALDLIAPKGNKEVSYKLPYLGKTISFTPHKAWVFPMLASLKAAMDVRNGSASWKVPPAEVFDAVAVQLFEKVKKSFDDAQKVLNTIGRNSDLYEVLTNKMEKAVAKLLEEGKGLKKSATA